MTSHTDLLTLIRRYPTAGEARATGPNNSIAWVFWDDYDPGATSIPEVAYYIDTADQPTAIPAMPPQVAGDEPAFYPLDQIARQLASLGYAGWELPADSPPYPPPDEASATFEPTIRT